MSQEQLVLIIGTIMGAGAFWKYLTTRAEHANAVALADKEDRAEFNATLREQVNTLMSKVDILVDEKEELLNSMAELRAELAEAKATIRHLEEVIRMRSADYNNIERRN